MLLKSILSLFTAINGPNIAQSPNYEGPPGPINIVLIDIKIIFYSKNQIIKFIKVKITKILKSIFKNTKEIPP